ncbi:hypothetical protein [Rathayibacter iranicus]|uniref:Uncharacterized protein n=2 Tax=Rathayibacter iranicus TaxID=59737 RepID=A0AAD1EP84_9MICO|nr:hypothetical protein [Rathayibacter iranicus]AZZ57389.1 hypothetical protein C7V51_07630 [Rathayibacter iranicus]MWV30819.1 hypothetical protein [Rathayibacter iranicus NCPPB 2253 = VKM Ac-1602]PPI47625.1 hypothetical protein C5E09_06665 [Rathayibacter iranicus]PPI60453.1 hypothetical protein C5E08_07595 [Rathayibacter iranicus]PPI72206.1 hypothetical protein C5E01_06640 [Rathayibacter iranicus]
MTVEENGSRRPRTTGVRPVGLLILIAVLALETLAVAALAIWLVVELLTTAADTPDGGIAIIVLALIALGWAVATTLGAVRRRGWMRGSALTMQLVVMAIALGAFQGQYAVPDIGWALLAPALVATVTLFLPSVVAVTRREIGLG